MAHSPEAVMTSEVARLRDHADRIIASGSLGRSNVLQRLFEFLRDVSLDGRAPKEVEIAEAVFGRGGDFDGALDGSVRVAIHRLRRKLEEHYAAASLDGERLVIPRGGYRLVLAPAAEVASVVEPADEAWAKPPHVPAPPPLRPAGHLRRRLGLAFLVVLACTGWALALLPLSPPWRDGESRALARTALWAPLAGSARPTLIVVGDYYIFGEADANGQVRRLVREFFINSHADLDEYLMTHPDEVDRYRDLELSYLPTGSAAALRQIVPATDGVTAKAAPRARLIMASELTPAMLKSSNIVYVGYLSGLGLLRDTLFAASRFEVGPSYDDLIDEKTGKRYIADGPNEGGRAPRRDYGYVAAFPGPTGNHVVIVAGTRDAALMQAAEIATDPGQVARAAGQAQAFEALYEVGTLGNLNVTSRLQASSPLRPGMWTESEQRAPSFPDDVTQAR